MGHVVIRSFLFALLVALLPACKTERSNGLTDMEVDFLSEDVFDVMAIAFAIGENAYLGDVVSFSDIIEEATPVNGFILTYDLPPDFRLGLGPGLGRVRLSVKEDGRLLADPLAFSFSVSDALDVEISYEIEYEGQTLGGRGTDVQFKVDLIASRVSDLEPFFVDYVIDGDCYLGDTYCRYTTWLSAPGLPHLLLAEQSDAEGKIDDPDLLHEFDLDIDYRSDGSYIAEGWVGCCDWFRESFTLPR